MTQFTMEALVNANSFTNEEISTIMGIEDNFLIRVGDNGHDKNQLNVGYGTLVDGQETNARGSIYVERPLLNTGQWYHIAVTFDAVNHERGRIEIYVDGELVASIDEATTDQADTYLTSKVSPDSEGLVAYWKFCDATGSVIADYSGNGNDLQSDHAPTWVEVELPEK